MREGLYSIILLSYFSAERIKSVFELVDKRLKAEGIKYEFIVIDDGSTDSSYQVAKQLADRYDQVHAFQLSRNFTVHYAKFAGFSVAKGALVTSMPDDWQTPMDVYVKMYREWQQGAQVIIPYRNKRNDGILNEFFARSYYKIMNSLSDVSLPPLGADIFAIDRELVDIINDRIHPINTSTLIEVLRLGFDPVYFPYERPKNIYGKSRWTFKKKMKLFKDTFYASSDFPIKLITWTGLLSFLLSLIVIAVSTILKLSGQERLGGFKIPGWTTTLIIMAFFCGLILLSVGIIAEYLLRVFDEVKNRPGYIIKKRTEIK
ncbi:MAG: glycosyltransferase [Candidatus Cloacimonetes bacterium]|jgi:dolichol-phosphate mannosyltransferase|nr:glycosyltransferase [Candidatus Cloacimonadota bacterium]